jgi:hypothetical protein
MVPAFQIRGFEGSIGLNDNSHTLLAPVIHWQSTVSMALPMEVSGAGGAPWGVIGTEMSSASVPEWCGSAPGSSGTMRLELPELYLPGSSDFASPPVNWGQVESKVELACL